MPYTLHIERRSGEITLDEWIAAVAQVPGVRLSERNSLRTNPTTGQEISFPHKSGDVDVLFHGKGFLGFKGKHEWRTCILFSHGTGTFNASDGIESPRNPVHAAASKLARMLGAEIVGDEGERYDW